MGDFGRYQLLARIATGGMAEIFIARSAGINGFEKELVIKRMREELSSDQKFSSKFLDEARLTIGLTHPNVVQVFDFRKADGAYYIAMEHVDGCDVATLLTLPNISGKGLPIELALLVTREVCKGLDYAHNKRDHHGKLMEVIHRDVSPQNILLGFEGTVKLTDFGIARVKDRARQTEPGMVVGKLAYMSPEHATGKAVDRRSDVFSLGTVLWEMLVGRRVYDGQLSDKMMDRIRKADIRPPSQVNSSLPSSLDGLVMKAVARDADDRFTSAEEFGHAIQRVMTQQYPECSTYSLRRFMEGERSHLNTVSFADFDDEVDKTEPGISLPTTGRRGTMPMPDPFSEPGDDLFDWSPELIEAIEAFRQEPSL